MMIWDKVKWRVRARFINMDRNLCSMPALPFKEFLDMTVVFYMEMGAKERVTVDTTVNHDIQRKLGQDSDSMFEQAVENISVNDMHLIKLSEMAGMKLKEENDLGMYVLTNRKGVFGAALILSGEIRERIIEFFGETVYVIPSSIHEVILSPMSVTHGTVKELRDMVQEINETLPPTDVLADSIYVLDMKGNLSIAE